MTPARGREMIEGLGLTPEKLLGPIGLKILYAVHSVSQSARPAEPSRPAARRITTVVADPSRRR